MNDPLSRRLGTYQTGPSDHLTRVLPTWSSDWWWLLAVALITGALCSPFVHHVWLRSDEGYFLHGAERMLHGDRIYVDFFEFLPPGAFLIVQGWLGITGISLVSARVLAVVTIAGIAYFIYLACRQASKTPSLSAFIALGWVMISGGDWVEIGHHLFTTLFSMVAAWAALTSTQRPQSRSWGPLIAGIAVGAAVMVTPHRGALAMLAGATAYLNLRRYWSEMTTYVLGSALIPILIVGYLIGHGALTAAFDDVVVFTSTRYMASAPVVAFGSGAWANIYHMLLFPLIALVALLAFVHDWRKWRHDRLLWTCAAFALAGFFGCYPRPDVDHIAAAAPLAFPLLAYCLRQLTRRWQRKYRYAAAAVVIACFVPSARWFLWSIETHAKGDIVSMARGRVSAFPRGAGDLAERIAATPADDGYLFYPDMPMLPFLTARRHVARYDLFFPNYTTPAQFKEACVSATRSATWVVIDRDWIAPRSVTARFPGLRDPEPPEAKKFLQALETSFEFVARDGAFEMRRRAAGVDDSVCDNIAE